MRRVAALLLACAGCSGSPTPHAPADLALPDGGILALRPYDLDVPAAYDSSVAHPLLVLLHGYASNGADIEHYFGVPALVESRQLLVALPEGTKNSAGYRFWNATDACCDYELSGVDDVSAISTPSSTTSSSVTTSTRGASSSPATPTAASWRTAWPAIRRTGWPASSRSRA